MSFITRISHGWNAFMNKDPTEGIIDRGYGSYYRPDRSRLSRGNERSIITSVYNKLSLDVAGQTINHVRLDENGRFVDTVSSGLNECLNISTNIDQTPRTFIQDCVLSLFDEGSICIVPTETTLNPTISTSFEINALRCGKIVQWYPKHVRVELYNDLTGLKEELTFEKQFVCVIENPLYAVMNEPNSTLKRLINKLNLLDAIDEQSSSGKLDIIIQLPYSTKTTARKAQAVARRSDMEEQLMNSRYGVAYADATEKITQLNRPAENNLLGQIQYLTDMLYAQLGLTPAIFAGTADEKEMLNYYNRTIEPILSAIIDEMRRKFLTKTARTQGQSIMYFRDIFKLVTMADLTEAADKLTRNEILSSNDVRSIIGYKPSKNPKAEELRNKNIAEPDTQKQEVSNKKDIQIQEGETNAN